jgi:BlaI family transcriptional regulator, penicillinase repressor
MSDEDHESMPRDAGASQRTSEGTAISGDESGSPRKPSRGHSFITIGPLEADIMRVVWARQRVTVRDVYGELREQRAIAYTTVMTVLTSLRSKRMVTADCSAAAFVYSPAVSQLQVACEAVDAVVRVIMGGEKQPLIEYLKRRGAG